MIIIDDKTEEVEVKIPNNLQKNSNVLNLKSTERKTTHQIEFEDKEVSSFFYVFDHIFNIPDGEYEYEIDGNKGLLRINTPESVTVYDSTITFKTYNN